MPSAGWREPVRFSQVGVGTVDVAFVAIGLIAHSIGESAPRLSTDSLAEVSDRAIIIPLRIVGGASSKISPKSGAETDNLAEVRDRAIIVVVKIAHATFVACVDKIRLQTDRFRVVGDCALVIFLACVG